MSALVAVLLLCSFPIGCLVVATLDRRRPFLDRVGRALFPKEYQ